MGVQMEVTLAFLQGVEGQLDLYWTEFAFFYLVIIDNTASSSLQFP